MTPSANDLYREAQRLILLGQPVFPCRSIYQDEAHKDKAPLTRNGVLNATLDRDKVKVWWQKYKSGAALGLATGFLWDVLDVDIKDGIDGRIHLHALTELGLLNGCKRVVRTPSGGYHLYFLAFPGQTNKARGATLGLDVRGLGGYVLAPPSYIETPKYKGTYTDIGVPSESSDEPLLWDLIVSNLLPTDEISREPITLLPSERRSSIASLREWTANLKEGERNTGMFWALCRCIESGIDPEELIEPALLTGLTEEEIRKSINSALKRVGVSVEELSTELEAMFPDE